MWLKCSERWGEWEEKKQEKYLQGFIGYGTGLGFDPRCGEKTGGLFAEQWHILRVFLVACEILNCGMQTLSCRTLWDLVD